MYKLRFVYVLSICSLFLAAPVLSASLFVRGDVNADGEMDLPDAVFTLNYLFAGGEAPACIKTADANDDGKVDISDPVYCLHYLFTSGPQPQLPFPECGLDITADQLGCNNYPECEAVSAGLAASVCALMTQVLEPKELQNKRVSISSSPLPSGTEITPWVEESADPIILKEDSFFVFIDDLPMAFFAHPVRYVIIVPGSEEVSVYHRQWWPAIDGKDSRDAKVIGRIFGKIEVVELPLHVPLKE